MKRISLLLGALGGAMAGYIMSNKKLRDQLTSAKDTQQMAALLGKHVQSDGAKLAKHVKEFVESEDVQQNLQKAKKYAQDTTNEAIAEMKKLVNKAAKKPAAKAKKVMKATKKK